LRYYFEWDPSKANENLRKHKISFERAATVFLDAYTISIFDKEHSQDEDRCFIVQYTHYFSPQSDQQRGKAIQ